MRAVTVCGCPLTAILDKTGVSNMNDFTVILMGMVFFQLASTTALGRDDVPKTGSRMVESRRDVARHESDEDTRPLRAYSVEAVIEKWIALGSLCSPIGAPPLEVPMERQKSVQGPLAFSAEFDLSALRVDSRLKPEGSALAFARDCFFRLGVTQPPGARLSRISAEVAYVSSKSAQADITLLSRVGVGSFVLDTQEIVLNRDVSHETSVQRVTLDKVLRATERGITGGCGAKTIVGVDLTWIVELPNHDEWGSVGAAGEQTLKINLEFAPCDSSLPVQANTAFHSSSSSSSSSPER